MKSLQKEQKAQIMEYKPQSAGINMQSPQSDSTPWTLTLCYILVYDSVFYKTILSVLYHRLFCRINKIVYPLVSLFDFVQTQVQSLLMPCPSAGRLQLDQTNKVYYLQVI